MIKALNSGTRQYHDELKIDLVLLDVSGAFKLWLHFKTNTKLRDNLIVASVKFGRQMGSLQRNTFEMKFNF